MLPQARNIVRILHEDGVAVGLPLQPRLQPTRMADRNPPARDYCAGGCDITIMQDRVFRASESWHHPLCLRHSGESPRTAVALLQTMISRSECLTG